MHREQAIALVRNALERLVVSTEPEAISAPMRLWTTRVTVAQAAVQPPISFRLDVMPVFMRAGCDTGSLYRTLHS
jgi:hypothetical protein